MRISDETEAQKSKVEAEALGSGRCGRVGSHCLSNKVSKTSDKTCTEITPRNHNMRLVDEVDDVLTYSSVWTLPL